MHNLGFMVKDLSPSQEAFYLINYANKAVMQDGHDVIVFYENPSAPCLTTGFAIMQTTEAWSFSGPLVASNLNLASKLIQFPGTKQKYFYVWDLEWVRMQTKNFSILSYIYRNPSLKLLARSREHARIIASCWNVPHPPIVENYNIDKIVEIINDDRDKQRLSTA
jgi:hypothetical protein